MFIINATTGVISMSPTLDQWTENLNYESTDPNPIPLNILLTDSAPVPSTASFTVLVVVVNGTVYSAVTFHVDVVMIDSILTG
jgi:hypothetical protein